MLVTDLYLLTQLCTQHIPFILHALQHEQGADNHRLIILYTRLVMVRPLLLAYLIASTINPHKSP